MKGLFIKDLKMMRHQGRFFALVLVITVFLSMSDASTTLIIGYMSFLASIFTLSTLSYDELDNGYAFLFSMPVSRKGYVVEKYEFGLMLGAGAWLLSTGISLITRYTKYSIPVRDTAMNALWILPVLFVLIAVMLPVQLQFGSEKSRVVLAAGGLFVVAFAFMVEYVDRMLPIDLEKLFALIPTVGTGVLITAVIVIAIAVLAVSCRISIGIVRRKEF